MLNIKKTVVGVITAAALLLTGCSGGGSSSSPASSGASGASGANNTSEGDTMTLSEKQYTELDGSKVKIIGRYASDDNGVLWLAHSASGVEFTMKGTAASVTILGDSAISTDGNQARFAVYVDGERVLDELIKDPEKTYDFFKSDAEKEITVTILKLSEAAQSTMGIKSINVTSSGDIAPTPAKQLKIEFIGDSITCGYGVDDEDRDHHFSTATEDATRAYAYKTAMALGADYSLVSYSGHGIISGYTTKGKKVEAQQVPKLYGQVARSYASTGDFAISTERWDFANFTPDIVVINLGTNDASYTGNDPDLRREYIDAYIAFLGQVREKNPNAHIICALGIMGLDLFASIKTVVQEYTAATGDENISTFGFTVQDGNTNGYAADWHPTAKTHDIAAAEFVEYIKSVYSV